MAAPQIIHVGPAPPIPIEEVALGDLALHAVVPVLHHAGHDRMLRFHEGAQLRGWVVDVLLHHVRLGQQRIFDGVGRQ